MLPFSAPPSDLTRTILLLAFTATRFGLPETGFQTCGARPQPIHRATSTYNTAPLPSVTGLTLFPAQSNSISHTAYTDMGSTDTLMLIDIPI